MYPWSWSWSCGLGDQFNTMSIDWPKKEVCMIP
jgi:hypothetical protein